MKRVFWLAIAIVAAGCTTVPPPDPNDPSQVGLMQADVIMRNLKWMSDSVNMRVDRGEITTEHGRQLVRDYAAELTKNIDFRMIAVDRAWEYAEVFRSAHQWDKARALLEVALRKPANEDRRVNDTLRMAHVLAELGDVPNAITFARLTFNTTQKESAPLIPAITLEIAPAGRGKGHDKELAQLIRDAIPIWDKTVVDPNSQAGMLFIQAKPYLIRRSERLAADLDAGVSSPAEDATLRAKPWEQTERSRPPEIGRNRVPGRPQ